MRRASVLIGDRENPLEADLKADLCREAPEIGKRAEVSPVAGGDLSGLHGKFGPITGVLKRYGRTVGYEVDIDNVRTSGSKKDYYVDQCVLEDVQPQTPTSVGLREALSHWRGSRDYWGPMLDGLENLCFELASMTRGVKFLPQKEGWKFFVPEPVGTASVIDCRVSHHENYWTLMVGIYPCRGSFEDLEGFFLSDKDHWLRTYKWAEAVALHMVSEGLPWMESLVGMKNRRYMTESFLIPVMGETLPRVVKMHTELYGPPKNLTPISVGVSRVRLKPATVALTEPPTDRHAYAIITLSPQACSDEAFFRQVSLHESIHYVVAVRGGDPHGERFQTLAQRLGLNPEYRD
jgi:hypothetical protein